MLKYMFVFFHKPMSNGAGVPVIAGLAAGIVLVILFASFAGQLSTSERNVRQVLYMVEADGNRTDIAPVKAEEEEQDCFCISFQVWDAETYVKKTGKSAVKVGFLAQNVTIQRGSYSDVPLLLEHIGGANSERYVTVRVVPPSGYTLYPKSVAEASTPEERFEASKSGTVLNGGIDLAQFVVATNPVNIIVSNEKIVYVRLVVPANLSSEVDGTFLPISLEVTSPEGGSSGDSVFAENTGIELIIPSKLPLTMAQK